MRAVLLRAKSVLAIGICLAAFAGFFILGIAAFKWNARQREISRATDCDGNMGGMLMAAMQEYHGKYGHFPPAYLTDANGRPMHSWRVLLLEFYDFDLYSQYDFSEPWDSPKNRKLAEKCPRFYSCPNDDDPDRGGRTNYFVVVGEGTAFPGERTTRLSDISDPANTILVIEAVGMDIAWTEPRDLLFEEMSFALNDPRRPSISSKYFGGPIVCMADGSAKVLIQESPEAVKAMLTIRKTTVSERFKVLAEAMEATLHEHALGHEVLSGAPRIHGISETREAGGAACHGTSQETAIPRRLVSVGVRA